jgi:signal transduction histidine kinase/CheY-like chemotaxis protein
MPESKEFREGMQKPGSGANSPQPVGPPLRAPLRAPHLAPLDGSTEVPARARRRRLATRLTWAFVSLAVVLILVVGLVLTFISYNAQVEQVIVRQQRTADGAAVLTSEYLTRARDTLWVHGYTASGFGLLLRSMESQLGELESILTGHGDMFQTVTLVNDEGDELAKVSRYQSFSPQDMGSLMDSQAFQRALAGQVYIDAQTRLLTNATFPTVLMAVPIRPRTGGERQGVLMADVSVEGMLDAVAQVRVGETGYAYIIDRDTGKLVAHSNADSFVSLQDQSLADVPIVRQVMEETQDLDPQYRGLNGEPVIGAASGLRDTNWTLIVELPTREALADVRQMLYLLAILIVVGALAAAGLGSLIPRRIVQPLMTLQEGAQQVGAGHLEHVIHVTTEDEIQDLAESFNQMAANLRASQAELEQWGRDLEVKVEERTRELAQVSTQMQRRALQLQASAEVARAIASVRDLDVLLPQVTHLISQRFGWYHVGIFLLDQPVGAQDAEHLSAGRKAYAVLRAANSPGGQRMLARGHMLRVGETGIVGYVTHTGQPRIALDVGQDAVFFDNPELPNTRSEMALPLAVGGRIIGALDVQSVEAEAYDDEDVALLRILADQVAIAIDNARLFEQTQKALEEVRTVHRRYIQREWTKVTEEQHDLVGEYRRRGTGAPMGTPQLPTDDPWPPELLEAVSRGELVVRTPSAMAVPALRAPDSSESSDVGDLQRATAAGTHPAGGQRGQPDLSGPRSVGRSVRNGSPTDRFGPALALAAPIKYRDQVIGGLDLIADAAVETDGSYVEEAVGAPLNLQNAGGRPVRPRQTWTEDEITLVQAISDQVGLALENARLFADTQRRSEQLSTINRIGLSINSDLDLAGVLNALYEEIRHMLDVDSFYVALYDAGSGFIEFPLLIGPDGSLEVEPRHIDQVPGLTGHVVKSKKPLYLRDAGNVSENAEYEIVQVDDHPTGSYVGVPLLSRDQVIGVISVQSSRANAYTQEDVELLETVATQASTAIENARAYEQLADTARELREIDRFKTQFLANMSHELRTPLNSIIGFSRVMLKGIDGPLTELQEADLNSIYNSGQHLLALINSILDMSKIEAGKMELSFEEVHLPDILNAVLSTTKALVKDRPIALHFEVPPDLPTVWADAQRVRQVLLNLMSNAAKFTEEGHIALEAKAGPEFVTIRVADTGVGISPEAHRRLFIPFQQVDGSTTRRAGGTGLGLAISRSFVEMHGGEIWVESQTGKGSIFTFTLPIYRVLQQKQAEATDYQFDPNKKVVLTIDDDLGVITLMRRYLENDRYQVVGVTESYHALQTAQRLAGDLTAITLDVVMPHSDGWQVLRALKHDPQTRDIPVILCSIVEGVEQGLEMGAALCLRKPITRDELLNALRKVERAASPRPYQRKSRQPEQGLGDIGPEDGQSSRLKPVDRE